jgi:hypothetical protein
MSLNPSNAIAAAANPDKTMFPNLASRIEDKFEKFELPEEEKKLVFDKIDNTIRAELMQAGVLKPDGTGDYGNYLVGEGLRKAPNGVYVEVPCGFKAWKFGWGFERRWYYYACEGPGIPPEKAEEFHQTWGTQVRVEGHCGCPSPLEYCHGFAVSSYHIDTQEGLNAFVDLLRSIWRP